MSPIVVAEPAAVWGEEDTGLPTILAFRTGDQNGMVFVEIPDEDPNCGGIDGVTGEGYPVVSDRDNLRMGSFGQFRSQMNRNGDVYYIDLNGYIGSYSDSDGLTEQRITDSEYPIAVFDQALSSDGDLFSASVVRGADAEQVILGYNIEKVSRIRR